MSAAGEAVRLVGEGGDELEGRLFEPPGGEPDAGRGAVLLHDAAGPGPEALGAARALAAEGLRVLALDLYSRAESAPESAEGPAGEGLDAWRALPDRRAAADVDAALEWLGAREGSDPRSLAVVGLGTGATLAFLVACTSRRVAAVVLVGGSTLHPELSAAKPTQPIELALNLDRPLLAVHGEEDPHVLSGDHALLREALQQGMKAFELELVPGGGRLLDPDAPGHDPERAAEVVRRAAAFLRDVL